MYKRSDQDLTEDILICLSKIEKYIDGITYDMFINDYKTQDAIVRNLEIIGEASKKISSELKKKYQDIPWKIIAGTRDKLIHDYFGANIDIVSEIATNDEHINVHVPPWWDKSFKGSILKKVRPVSELQFFAQAGYRNLQLFPVLGHGSPGNREAFFF